jgi:uncharacterized membrane protein
MKQYKYKSSPRKINMKRAIILILFISLLFIPFSSAAITGANVTYIGNKSYSDIWLGVSTGGYDLIAEKGETFEFEVFVKNGMTNRSMHNLQIIPKDMQFPVNSITPKIIEQIKPMEIIIFRVNVTIPSEIPSAKYTVKFDLASLEFPAGIFSLETEIKVVDRIRVELYLFYTFLILFILFWLFYRKWKQNKK